MAKSKLTTDARFWGKVGAPDADSCRPWLAGRNQYDYGTFWFDGRQVQAHAFAWRLTYHGPTKPGAEVFRHSCDHPWCCESAHIYPGTNAENTADRHAKRRDATGDRNGARTHPERRARGDRHFSKTRPDRVARGERNSRARLTEGDVHRVRAAFLAGENRRDIAMRYGIREGTVYDIAARRIWAWL